ncbi:hypothetical protein D3C71_1356670 [compost metagenome]
MRATQACDQGGHRAFGYAMGLGENSRELVLHQLMLLVYKGHVGLYQRKIALVRESQPEYGITARHDAFLTFRILVPHKLFHRLTSVFLQ